MTLTATPTRTRARITRITATWQTPPVNGVTAGGVAAWVEDRFNAGWRRLTVVDWATGEQIAGIGRDRATGVRTWWARDWPYPNPEGDPR